MNYKKIKFNNLLFLLKDIKKEDKILDVGCGLGEITSMLNDRGYNVKGIDINSKTISKAKQLYPKVNFEVGDVKDVDYSKYNVIILWGVFEYVFEMSTLLKKIENEMKVNSVLIFAVPNVCSFSNRVKCLFGQNPNRETIFHYSFTFKQIKTMVDKMCFKYKKITSLYVDCIKNVCFPTTKKFSGNIIVKLIK